MNLNINIENHYFQRVVTTRGVLRDSDVFLCAQVVTTGEGGHCGATFLQGFWKIFDDIYLWTPHTDNRVKPNKLKITPQETMHFKFCGNYNISNFGNL